MSTGDAPLDPEVVRRADRGDPRGRQRRDLRLARAGARTPPRAGRARSGHLGHGSRRAGADRGRACGGRSTLSTPSRVEPPWRSSQGHPAVPHPQRSRHHRRGRCRPRAAASTRSFDAQFAATGWTAVANATGWAAISLPLGEIDGFPVGVQLLRARRDGPATARGAARSPCRGLGAGRAPMYETLAHPRRQPFARRREPEASMIDSGKDRSGPPAANEIWP